MLSETFEVGGFIVEVVVVVVVEVACKAGVQRGGREESENLCMKCEENAKRDRWDLEGIPTIPVITLRTLFTLCAQIFTLTPSSPL